jgi:hypothetical protein
MKPWQRDQLQRALEQRREVLMQELGGDELHVREGGGDLAQADLLRDQDELRDIEAARRRPEAARCIDCQRRHEKTYR